MSRIFTWDAGWADLHARHEAGGRASVDAELDEAMRRIPDRVQLEAHDTGPMT